MTTRHAPFATFLLAVCLLFTFFLTGCATFNQLLDGGEKTQSTTPQTPPRQDPLTEARNALATGGYAKAEAISQRLATREGVSPQVLKEALTILAKAATRNNHPNVALSSLDRLRLLQPGLDADPDWLETWSSAMDQLSSYAAAARAEEVLKDTGRSYAARGNALIFKSARSWQANDLGSTLPDLESFYGQAPDKTSQASLEQRLLLRLYRGQPGVVALLLQEVGPDNESRYPYTIIQVADLHLQAGTPERKAQAEQGLQALAKKFSLADPSLFTAVPLPRETAPLPTDPISSGPIAGRPVVMALPMSGNYGAVSAKIAAGAAIACQEFTSAGAAASLVVIDTDQPDWVARINGLPPEAVVVGGPMRPGDMAIARAQGLTGQRVFLAFLSRLEDGEEGRIAWRFFSSPEDQVDTLLRFTSGLGISGYGILSPDESYGHRMSQIFAQRAQALGGRVTQASYAPGQPTTWLKTVGEFVGHNQNPSHGGSSTFQAVFLPDTWANMDILVPNMFYYNETKQVLLGTNLWGQGLMAPNAFASPQYYSLAVFPGAWDQFSEAPAAQRLQASMLEAGKGEPDLWAAIGYDFARFAVGLNIRPGWNPAQVNAALSQNDFNNWSMAPIFWDGAGRASQQLFLFQPDEAGSVKVDEAEFRALFQNAWR